MSREICSQCQRPMTACICQFVTPIKNVVHVVVLQHPSEVSQTKGTVTLLNNSLAECRIIIGEDFSNNIEFQALFNRYNNRIALLYPSETAKEVAFSNNKAVDATQTPHANSDIDCIILLDGTWKKAYRMFMINEQLQNMPHIILPKDIESLYQIRKTKKDNALSSLEACCHALSRIENNPNKYQNLLNNFVKFNQFQLSFVSQ